MYERKNPKGLFAEANEKMTSVPNKEWAMVMRRGKFIGSSKERVAFIGFCFLFSVVCFGKQINFGEPFVILFFQFSPDELYV